MVAEDYIHRIGRTGRAGASGIAVSLVGPEDWSKLGSIERLIGRRLERETIPGLEPKRPPRATGRPHQPQGRKPGGKPARSFHGKGGQDFNRGANKSGQGKPRVAAAARDSKPSGGKRSWTQRLATALS